MNSPYLTKAEAAEYARVHPATIDRARKTGALEDKGTPGRVRLTREDIDRWLEGRGHRRDDE